MKGLRNGKVASSVKKFSKKEASERCERSPKRKFALKVSMNYAIRYK